MTDAAPLVWRQADGIAVSCHDKLLVLRENHEELRHVMQDAFDDALLIGVDEAEMRRVLTGMVSGLKSPRR